MNLRLLVYLLALGCISTPATTVLAQDEHEIDSLNQRLTTEISDRQRVDIYNRLARIQYTDSLVVATNSEKALQLAQKINYPEGISDAYYNLGLSAFYTADDQQAAAWYTKALQTAQEASYRNGQAKACFELGRIYREQGQFSEAHEYYSRALEIYTELGNKIREAVTIWFIGITYERQGDYPEALDQYHEAFARFSTLSVEPYYFADLHVDLGNVYSRQARYPEAVDHYLSALGIYEQLGDKDGKAGVYNSIGVVFYEQKNYDQALNYYQESLKLDLELGDKRWIANSYNNVALIHEHQNRLDSALFYYHQSLVLAQESQDNYILAWVFNGMAIVYQKKQEYQQALEYVQQAIALRESAGNQEVLAQSYNTLGKNYLALGQYKNALAIYQKSQRICEEIGNPLNLKDALEGISLSYEGLNQVAKAYPYLKRFKAVSDSLSSEENKKGLIAKTMQFEFDQQQALAQAEAEKQELLHQQEINEQRQYIYTAIAGFFALLVIVLMILRGRQKQQQTNRLLAQQNEDIHRQKEQLQEMDTIKSRFFTNISHEFRTPLTLVMGQIESFLTAPDTDKLKMAHRNAAQLQRLINQLLDLSKLEGGKMTLRASCQNIVPLLRHLTSTFESMAEQKNIALRFESTSSSIRVYYEQDKVEKILYNLLSNALKFTPTGGQVLVKAATAMRGSTQVGTSEEKGELKISVRDSGVGIPADRLPHIFDRFFQVDSSHTREFEGTGIGLALTKELVQLHGGGIAVESTEGFGTTFTVTLPLDKAHLPAEQIVDVAEVSTGFGNLSGLAADESFSSGEVPASDNPEPMDDKKDMILIVEDNADMRTYIRQGLERAYHILEAANGEEGFTQAQEHVPDLIITDVMMPQVDGYEFTRKIRQETVTAHIPIIMLTAKAAEEDKLAGLEQGVDAYLTKPFNKEELLIRVRKLIEMRQKLRQQTGGQIILQPGEIAATSLDQQFLQQIQQTIEDNINNEAFGVDKLALEVGVSQRQLQRKLKALTDHSPQQCIRTMRLGRAKQLLEQGAGTVTQIAFQVGYGDLTAFSKAFHAEFGQAPSVVLQKKSS